MGEGFWCDMCGASLPTAGSLTPVKVGEEQIVNICLTCAGRVKAGFTKTKVETDKAKRAAAAHIAKEAAEAKAQAAAEEEAIPDEDLNAAADASELPPPL